MVFKLLHHVSCESCDEGSPAHTITRLIIYFFNTSVSSVDPFFTQTTLKYCHFKRHQKIRIKSFLTFFTFIFLSFRFHTRRSVSSLCFLMPIASYLVKAMAMTHSLILSGNFWSLWGHHRGENVFMVILKFLLARIIHPYSHNIKS